MVGEMMEAELPTVWKHMANPEGDFYWPMVV